MAHSVDDLDLRILRALGVQPFMHGARSLDALKPSALAKQFGVTAETVRDRLAQLERDGVIDGYEAYPNYRHLGLSVTSHMFRVPGPGRKTKALQDLADMDGVICVMGFASPELSLDLVHKSQDDLGRKVRLLEKIMGDAQLFAYHEYVLPKVERGLSPLDWRILQALRGDGRRSPEELAYYVGASAKTVKRHLDRMFAEGSLDVIPVIHPGNLVGAVMFILFLSLDPKAGEAERQAIVAAFEENWFRQFSPPGTADPNLGLAMIAASTKEVEEIRLQAESMPGVTDAQVLIPNMMHGTEHWLDELIAEKAGEGPLSEVTATNP